MTTAEKDLESVEEAASELRIGLGLVVFGALFVAVWFVGSDSGHGEVSLLRLPAIALLPLGAAFVFEWCRAQVEVARLAIRPLAPADGRACRVSRV